MTRAQALLIVSAGVAFCLAIVGLAGAVLLGLIPLPSETLTEIAPVEPTATVFVQPSPTALPSRTAARVSGPIATPENTRWVIYTLADKNFSISLPESWQRLPLDQPKLVSLLDNVGNQNPQLAAFIAASAPPLIETGVSFWAFDASTAALKKNYATNVSVLKKTLDSLPTLDAFSRANFAQVQSLPTRVGGVTETRIAINGVPAAKLEYHLKFIRADKSEGESALVQFLLLDGRDAYVLTLATTADQIGAYAGVFDRIGQSFKIGRGE